MSNVVADTIYSQLGGNRFKVMTGANSFAGSANSLSFKIPKAKAGVKGVVIELDADDTYSMRFIRMAGSFKGGDLRVETYKEFTGVYCDMLQEIFTEVTGLYTSL